MSPVVDLTQEELIRGDGLQLVVGLARWNTNRRVHPKSHVPVVGAEGARLRQGPPTFRSRLAGWPRTLTMPASAYVYLRIAYDSPALSPCRDIARTCNI